MGEVYRARDTRLDRDVAVKLLPAEFTREPERLARFEREAKLLAQLHHPNIASIFGLEEAGGAPALVMELVEGPTLAERLEQGPLPLEECLSVSGQIVDALEEAHEKGIVHRDLKPQNVKVTAEGKVKVLDFGLAKALDPAPGPASTSDMTRSPTLTSAGTQLGVILGTAGYMSPEQAKGKAVDRRVDIWAFGVVLYQMLAGQTPFRGDSVTETLSAITRDTPNWQALPAGTPLPVLRLLRRCLAKDPGRRLQHIGDARLEIEEALSGDPGGTARDAVPILQPPPRWQRLAPWTLAIVALGIAAWAIGDGRIREAAPTKPVQHFVLAAPAEGGFITAGAPAVLLSPDGTLVVSSLGVSRRWQLFVRSISEPDSHPIDGTLGAMDPFFAPDGRRLAFFAGGQLKSVSLSGGAPETVCPAPNPRGAVWAADDTIIFTPGTDAPLSQVPAAGVTPKTISTLDVAARERSHRWPDTLPGGRSVLFGIAYEVGNPLDDASIAVLDLATGRHRTILKGGGFPRYVPTGHIVYARRRAILAVPFDATRLEITGPAVTVVEGVRMSVTNGGAQFSFSRSGELAYVAVGSGDPQNATAPLIWVNRRGEEQVLVEERHRFGRPRISPDGRSVIVEISDPDAAVWSYSLERSTLSRLTRAGVSYGPVPSPDRKKIAFETVRDGVAGMFLMGVDGTGEERLTSTKRFHIPTSFHPDGRKLAMTSGAESGFMEVLLLPLDGARTPQPLVQGSFNTGAATFSPDGRWLAYVSDETGRDEVYVRSFPAAGVRVQISGEGGTGPVWSRSGRELFFRNGDELLAVDFAVRSAVSVSAGRPRVLFSRYQRPGQSGRMYDIEPDFDVTADGQRFVMAGYRPDPSATPSAHIVLNWFLALKEKLGAGEAPR
jgi:serine/threonine-protein kinase